MTRNPRQPGSRNGLRPGHGGACEVFLALVLGTLVLGARTAFAESVWGLRTSGEWLQVQAQSLDQLFEAPAEGEAPPAGESGGTSADSLFESAQPAAAPADSAQGAGPAAQTGQADTLFEPVGDDTAPAVPRAYRLSGFFQNELAYTYPSPDHYSKFKNTLELNLDGSAGSGINWRLGGRLVYDPIYDLTSFYPDPVRDDQTFEAQIREAYIDFSSGGVEFRLGRQHIIWGEVVGGFVADVVSAKDLRESVVQDFDLLRIPQWAAMAEYYKGDFYGQLLWIPYMTVNDIGKPGADFYPFRAPAPAGVTTVYRGDHRPSPALSNSGVGARVSYLTGGWDTSLFYFTSMDQDAAFRREILPGPQPTLVFTPIHSRIHQLGATVTKDIGPALVKLESVYTVDRLFSVTDLADPDGLVRQNVLDYIIGVEWVFEHDTRLNVQFSQRWFPDHVSSMLPDALESGFSIYASTKAWHTDVKPELLWIQSLNRGDWLLEAKLTWAFRPKWRSVVGADLFGGEPGGLFGRFDDNDRVYYELRYTF